ncbi:MAG: hypothetical protein Q4G49_04165 [Paracoccus sp. (in: a-proteobacteria)]|nr:hypothetical protein [Paracoccus sp. (in: a-proteobacteria)]
MPKIDLTKAVEMKVSAGRALAIRGVGFAWERVSGPGAVYGRTISVDTGNNASVAGSGASAGVFPSTSWVQASGFPNFAGISVADNTGSMAMVVGAEALAANSGTVSAPAPTGDYTMLRRGVTPTAGSAFIFSGVPFSEYDVIFYGNATGAVTFDATFSAQGMSVSLSGSGNQYSGSLVEGGNYIKLAGLVGPDVRIEFSSSVVPGRWAVCGFQVVERLD